MNAMLIFLIIVLASALIGLIVYFCCRFARIYRTLPTGERVMVGILWKWSRTYIVYDGLPFLGADRIGYIDQHMNVYLKTENNQHNFVDIHYGSTDDLGAISDVHNAVVASCDSIGQSSRSTIVNDGSQNEIAFVKTGFRKGDDLLVRAAAVGAFCALNVERDASLRADVRIGFKDLALPSALIFMLLFVPLAWLGYNTRFMYFLGSELAYVSYMMLAYGLICWVLYFIKKCLTMRNRSMTHLLGLIDRNVGVKAWNIVIIVLAVLLAISTIYVANYTLLPLFLVIALGFIINMKCFKEDWKIVDPCATWGSKLSRKTSVAAGIPHKQQALPGRVNKTYPWAPVLDARGITHANDEVVLTFTEDEYKDPTGRVRAKNPFLGNTGLTFDELKANATVVINGCDGADKEETNAIINLVNSAYQVCQRYNLADFELYELVLSFCQNNIEYVKDQECESISKTEEYFRFAAETLFDGQGDCDCKAVLAYKIFKALQLDVELALCKSKGSKEYNHVGVVIRKDSASLVPLPSTCHEYKSGHVYCELTGSGYKIGDVPKDVDVADIYLLK